MDGTIERCVKRRHFETYKRARERSESLLATAKSTISVFLKSKGLDGASLCFAVVGSVGRREALEASDFDVVPIASNSERLKEYAPHDAELRAALRRALGVKVSKGEDLTKATSIEELVEVDSIGGAQDNSGRLTKRVLLLTESAQAGGALPLKDVRAALLEAYSKQERTSGRHVLTLCNDIARYYKTLCIEYKAKIDEANKDWSTRNIKLRHSRKLWYFANMLAVATLADKHPQGEDEFKSALLDTFELPPVERLAGAIAETQPLAFGQLLERYALFLEFMAKSENRDALASVKHEDRYEMSLRNPFPSMTFCSDLIHQDMMGIMEELGPTMRGRIASWFLL
jgi:hypothetical protein